MPQSIPAGLTRTHVLQAITDLDSGVDHPFGQPTGYELVHEGKRYPPKAVIGLACKYSLRRVLLPEEFSGGEAPGQANFVLRKLGFTVVRKGETEQESDTSRDWTQHEVRLIVADYFTMLEAELKGEEYRKSEHRKALMPQLAGRSEGSVEFKHQNISAVLVEQGHPYVDGYKPRGNYQGLLAEEVERSLEEHPQFLEQLAAAPTLNPVGVPSVSSDLSQIIVDPPERIIAPTHTDKPWKSLRAQKIDFAERDAANRKLARLGEEFVFNLERHRLRVEGRDDLASRAEWVSQTIGDGLGFDILSFDVTDESERMLEVKATGLVRPAPWGQHAFQSAGKVQRTRFGTARSRRVAPRTRLWP
jgi:hypothetical protein